MKDSHPRPIPTSFPNHSSCIHDGFPFQSSPWDWGLFWFLGNFLMSLGSVLLFGADIHGIGVCPDFWGAPPWGFGKHFHGMGAHPAFWWAFPWVWGLPCFLGRIIYGVGICPHFWEAFPRDWGLSWFLGAAPEFLGSISMELGPVLIFWGSSPWIWLFCPISICWAELAAQLPIPIYLSLSPRWKISPFVLPESPFLHLNFKGINSLLWILVSPTWALRCR